MTAQPALGVCVLRNARPALCSSLLAQLGLSEGQQAPVGIAATAAQPQSTGGVCALLQQAFLHGTGNEGPTFLMTVRHYLTHFSGESEVALTISSISALVINKAV